MDYNRNQEQPQKEIVVCPEENEAKVQGRKLRQALDASIGAQDVLCGRGKTSFNHTGNRRFRDLITNNIEKYNTANSRYERALLVNELVYNIKSTGGRFLKRDENTKSYIELNDDKVKEKVAHAIRDANYMYEQKKKSKKPPPPSGSSSIFGGGMFGGFGFSETEDIVAGGGMFGGFSETEDIVAGGGGMFGGFSETEDSYASMMAEDHVAANAVFAGMKNVRTKRQTSLSSIGSDSFCMTSSGRHPVPNDRDDDEFVSIIDDTLGPMSMEEEEGEDPLGAFLASQNQLN